MMFQIYMVAPLIAIIGADMDIGKQLIQFLIPAITISMGISSLLSGKFIFHFGEKKIFQMTSITLALSAFSAYLSQDGFSLLTSRIICGVAMGSFLPLTFRIIAVHFPKRKRLMPIVIIIFGMAGGMTFGPVFGLLAYDFLGWRLEFAVMGIICTTLALISGYLWSWKTADLKEITISKGDSNGRKHGIGRICILLFILLNGIFHSGLFILVNALLPARYNLGSMFMGFFLLDFGLPGLILVVILAALSRWPGIIKMEIIGLFILTLSMVVILLDVPIWMTLLALGLLSVGYNITQPLFFGIVGKLGNTRGDQRDIQLGLCALFIGYGLGPLIFGFLLKYGNLSTVLFLMLLTTLLAIIASRIFEHED
ncbi:MFS transporter [Pedobacter jamesrossensis]|uniref:MFS transporter n=2 Tax=Pedobacter jamesrossensis TaxID=1908238 RepID=A0ABV8NNC1_9SPHI